MAILSNCGHPCILTHFKFLSLSEKMLFDAHNACRASVWPRSLPFPALVDVTRTSPHTDALIYSIERIQKLQETCDSQVVSDEK